MKLEEITAEIRPRTQWESVDLGVSLTRRHFPKLALIWVLTVFPIWAVIIVLLRNHPVWCLFTIWFFLPVYERPILYYLSRALFNAPPKIRDVLKSYPKIIAPGLLSSLTIARLSPVRSLLLPLHVLEGAKGSQYRNRRLAIMRSGGGTGGYMTFVCLFLELILLLGMVFLIISFIPEHIAPDWNELFVRFFFSFGFFDGLPRQLAWFAIAVLLIAISFVEIFYVGCGFALYLNSRSQVEGWDIEITFRRLATKITTIGTSLLALAVGIGSLLIPASTASAQNPPSYDEVKAQIRKIKEREEFRVYEEEVKIPKFDGELKEPNNVDLGWFVTLGKVVFWLVLIAGIIAIAWIIYLNRHLFTGGVRGPTKEEQIERTRTVMGMDIASDTLPDDIPAAALAAWRDGNPQLATSLLYRGAICWLVEIANLPLIDSDTEGDCIYHSSTLGDPGKHDYFSSLTLQWISTAYNDDPPSEPEIQDLCASWPFRMGGGTV